MVEKADDQWWHPKVNWGSGVHSPFQFSFLTFLGFWLCEKLEQVTSRCGLWQLQCSAPDSPLERGDPAASPSCVVDWNPLTPQPWPLSPSHSLRAAGTPNHDRVRFRQDSAGMWCFPSGLLSGFSQGSSALVAQDFPSFPFFHSHCPNCIREKAGCHCPMTASCTRHCISYQITYVSSSVLVFASGRNWMHTGLGLDFLLSEASFWG